MDWHQPRDRLGIRAYVRTQLRSRGLLEFADDDLEAARQAELVYMHCGSLWHEGALERTPLALDPLIATTTDAPMQGIDNTVEDNDEFWSSTGSASSAAGEALLYRLQQPLSHAAYVRMAVYRAHYQHGDPLYPPRKVSFLTGPTPNQLYPASPVYPVRLTDEEQVFALSPTAAVSQYLMVRLHGRCQRQWEDLQFYIAIRHVSAYGTLLQPDYTNHIVRLTAAGAAAWPSSRGRRSAISVAPLAAGGGAAGRAGGGGRFATASDGAVRRTRSAREGPIGPFRPQPQRAGEMEVEEDRAAEEGGSGRGRRGAAGAADEEALLPPPDVYEVGPRAVVMEGDTSFSSSTWWPSWWSSRPEAREAAAAAALTVAAQAPPLAVVAAAARSRSRAQRRGGDEACEGGSAGAAGAAHGRGAAGGDEGVADEGGGRRRTGLAEAGCAVAPTGPTDAELRRMVGRQGVIRALPQLVRVAWPEVLLVQGMAAEPDPDPDTELRLEPSGGAAAASHRHHHPGLDWGTAGRGGGGGGSGGGGGGVTGSPRHPRLPVWGPVDGRQLAGTGAAPAMVAGEVAAAGAAGSCGTEDRDVAMEEPAAAEDAVERGDAEEAMDVGEEAGRTAGLSASRQQQQQQQLLLLQKEQKQQQKQGQHLWNVVARRLCALTKKLHGDAAFASETAPGTSAAQIAPSWASADADAATAASHQHHHQRRLALAHMSYLVSTHPALNRNPHVHQLLRHHMFELATDDAQLSCPKAAGAPAPPSTERVPPPPPMRPGSGGGGRRRLKRRHHRAAQLALQQPLYTPGAPLFVALDAWSGPTGQQRAPSGGGAAGGSGGAGGALRKGGWLVSHYDHEHL